MGNGRVLVVDCVTAFRYVLLGDTMMSVFFLGGLGGVRGCGGLVKYRPKEGKRLLYWSSVFFCSSLPGASFLEFLLVFVVWVFSFSINQYCCIHTVTPLTCRADLPEATTKTAGSYISSNELILMYFSDSSDCYFLPVVNVTPFQKRNYCCMRLRAHIWLSNSVHRYDAVCLGVRRVVFGSLSHCVFRIRPR